MAMSAIGCKADIGWIGDSDVADVTALALCGLVPHLLQSFALVLGRSGRTVPPCPPVFTVLSSVTLILEIVCFFKAVVQMKGRIVNCLYNCLWTVAFSFCGNPLQIH